MNETASINRSRSGLRELLPAAGRIVDPFGDVVGESRPGTPDQPWVFTNMVSSLDGATAVDGLSGALGGPTDQLMLEAIRNAASVIIAGSATIIGEQYRPPLVTTERTALRASIGLGPRASIAVVSARLNFGFELPLFGDPDYRPIIVTTAQAPADRVEMLRERADIITAGSDTVDLAEALRALGQAGHTNVLLEGGPRLNGQMIAAGLVDEWNMTLSPALVGGDSARTAYGTNSADFDRLSLQRLWQGDDMLFGRWIRARR